MKAIRVLLAVGVLPAVFSGGYTLLRVFLSFAGRFDSRYAPFYIGVLVYACLQGFLYKPLRAYVFGHELTHAIAGLLSGAKIKKFKAGKESGKVIMNKSNVWITLSPYFVPIYTCIVIFVYLLLGGVGEAGNFYGYFLFFVGLTLAFHIALTIYIIRIGQPDLKIYGVFFSCVVILLINIFVFDLLLAITFPKEVDFVALMSLTLANTRDFYIFIFNLLTGRG
jgi:hypothetical protein